MGLEVSRADFLRLTAAALGGAGPAAVAAGRAPSDRDRRERLKMSCRGALTLRHANTAEEMARVSAYAQAHGLFGDRYVASDFIASFEKRIAVLLGFESACVMPTGIMAQAIALRLWAERAGRRTIGLHPTSHHLHEEADALSRLHQLEARVLGAWDRPLAARDIADHSGPLAAVSVELPLRWIGGQLPDWRELEAIKAMCRERGIALHMDGARLWEAQPFYDRPHAAICRGFDSVYVSLYKLIGAPGGAVLAGSRDLIAQARTWRRRHGGDLFQMSPYVISAAMRLEPALERVAGYRRRAIALSRGLATVPGLEVLPAPAQTSLFRVLLKGDASELVRRRDAIAATRGIWLANSFAPARDQARRQAELQIAEPARALADAEIIDAFAELVG